MGNDPRITRRKLGELALGTAALAAPGLARAQQTPLRFGVLLPMSGRAAFFGNDQITATSWALERINAAGGVAGRRLEMVTIDSQADPQTGINGATRLATVDRVPLFFVSWSAVVNAVAPVANRERVLQISSGATAPGIARLGQYVFTMYPLADVEGIAAATWHVRSMNRRRAGVLYINNESGIDGARVYREAFQAAGGQVTAYEAYDPRAADFTGVLLRLRAANPDIIWLQGDVPEIPTLVSQARRLGLTQVVATTSIGQNNRVLEQLGPAAEGLLVTSLAPGAEELPAVSAYVDEWQRRENRQPNGLPFTQYFYDAAYVAAALFGWALQRNLPPSGENLRRALVEHGPFDLPLTGELRVDVAEGRHTVRKPVYVLQVRDGAFRPHATIGV